MKLIKRIACAALALVLCVFTFSAALGEEAKMNIYTLKGPTGIGMVKMMDDNDGSYSFTLCGAPDEVVAAILSGSADVAAVPTNMAATLYNKTKGNVQIAALNTLGVLSIIEKGDTIHTIEDLKGKTIYATGQGSTPEYILNYILSAYGLTDDVKVVYYGEHSELASLAAAGKADIAMLPEPHVTSVLTQSPDFRIALDITEEYSRAAEKSGEPSEMSMGCVIFRKDYAEKNSETIDKFMADYGKSVEYVNNNVADAALLVEKFGIMPKAAVAQKAIPNCHIVFIAGEEMKEAVSPFFQVLYNANPKAVGGTLPEDDFYYCK